MKCEIVEQVISVGPHYGGGARSVIQCNTHQMVDFAPFNTPGLLCPVGKVEQAVEDGLKRLAIEMREQYKG